MSPMPSVSRAKGDSIWVVGVRGGFFLGAGFLEPERFGGAFVPPARLDARDDERRDGEVFVGIGRPV
jgi:hypothetical protein